MLKIYGETFSNRLLVGTACYPSLEIMRDAIIASEAEIITVSLRRQMQGNKNNNVFWQQVQSLNKRILPNTAGCHNMQDAITTAEMAREIFATDWIKLEVIGDDYNLQPDPFVLVQTAKELIQRGFKVFPYCTDDFIVCRRLLDSGCEVIMPWVAPIGSGKGIINPYALSMLRARLPDTTIIVDAGIGKPSHVVQAFEMGIDAVLLNTAIARAHDPVLMAEAFRASVQAGRQGFMAGLMQERNMAEPSTPVLDTPFWHQTAEKI